MYECFGWREAYPKKDFKFAWDVVDFVANGNMRPKPENMTDDQYNLIKKCWCKYPKERPDISTIIVSLNNLLNEK